MDLAATPTHPDLVRAAKVYARLAAGRLMPHRSDFSPCHFAWMLGRMYLLDVLDGGADYYFRILGTFWQTIYEANLRGQRLSELEAQGMLTKLRNHYDGILADPAPTFRLGTVVWPDGSHIEFQRLMLPFAGDDGKTALIVGTGACDKSNDDLIFFRGLGFPILILGGQDATAGA
jgi:hypothetical protein